MRTIEQVRNEGFDALLKALGPADALRFIQQYSSGSGDYAKERHEWLDQQSFEELAKPPKNRLVGKFDLSKT